MKTTIVTTTINVPRALEGYAANIRRYGHDQTDFVVIGDRKTPPEIEPYLASFSKGGYSASYWGVERQTEWLRRFPHLDRLIPWNSIQRRNLGYLIAFEQGADVIVSIDDDNFATDDDYVGEHRIVGQTAEVSSVDSPSGWFNVCDLLQTDTGRRIYHRGFPHSKRWTTEQAISGSLRGRVAVNAGLWLGTPDVDAVTHLEEPLQVTGLRLDTDRIALAPGTYCPFNSQNTAFHRNLVACTYLIVMGDEVLGMRIDRYDDIWMSYFVKKICDRLGELVCYGRPMVKQDRNPHNYLTDLWRELPGMILTEKLIVTLSEMTLSCSNHFDCYLELIEGLRRTACDGSCYSYPEKAYLLKLTDGMKIWADVCRELA